MPCQSAGKAENREYSHMYHEQWIQFFWDLTSLPPYHAALKPTLHLRKAEEEEAPRIWHTIERAYEMDQTWSVNLRKHLEALEETVMKGYPESKLEYLVLEDGKRVIAVSGIHPKAGSTPQLFTGVCVEDEYRCRGLGTLLLHASLTALAEAGLKEAFVVTRQRTNAARFLYTKFNSTSSTITDFDKSPKDKNWQLQQEAKLYKGQKF